MSPACVRSLWPHVAIPSPDSSFYEVFQLYFERICSPFLTRTHVFAWPAQIPQLVALEHPVPEFYKDEGGKANFMTFVVGLPAGYVITAPLPLKVSLYFESERRVEEKDQAILNLLGNEYAGFEITPEMPTATFEFRLEKVCVCVCVCVRARACLLLTQGMLAGEPPQGWPKVQAVCGTED